MEIGIDSAIPTYSGGLGILAGDTIRSAADLKLPVVAVTMLYRRANRQHLSEDGVQEEVFEAWDVEDRLTRLDASATVRIEGRDVALTCWRYDVQGVQGGHVPVLFLDTDLEENSPWDRTLSHILYGGDGRYRLAQEVVLGIGGREILRKVEPSVECFHMNEGHSSLLTLALLEHERDSAQASDITDDMIARVRQRCVFTTHTPVRAGHDEFDASLAEEVLGVETFSKLKRFAGDEGKLNMTYLALNLSQFVNGVARSHAEVSREMFDGYRIDSITNGVHAATWCSEPVRDLYDRYIPGWRQDNASLRYTREIPTDELWRTHQRAKSLLLAHLDKTAGVQFEPDVFTIGFARRATAYKRAKLLLHHPERLQQVAARIGAIQIIYAGKAHPHDTHGKDLIRQIFEVKKMLGPLVRVVYLEDYNFDMGRLLTSGVDLWLNTPEPPKEASGTSGMKAALNGVPSLSTLDGWWAEGHVEGVTGWVILEDDVSNDDIYERDAEALYRKLEDVVLPLYYQEQDRYVEVMRHAISLNGSFFNTERMVDEYARKAYKEFL